MQAHPFVVPPFFDYGATFLWAISGALLAARRGLDFVGMLALGLVSSVGGGLLRDGIFIQNGPPLLVRSPYYLLYVAGGVLVAVIFGRFLHDFFRFTGVMTILDAIGLGAFAIVGVDRAQAAALSIPGIVLVGVVNATGGAVLRDILLARTPSLIKPGVPFALAALFASILYLLLAHVTVTREAAPWITIGAVALIRIMAVRYDLQTKPLAHLMDESERPS